MPTRATEASGIEAHGGMVADAKRARFASCDGVGSQCWVPGLIPICPTCGGLGYRGRIGVYELKQ